MGDEPLNYHVPVTIGLHTACTGLHTACTEVLNLGHSSKKGEF